MIFAETKQGRYDDREYDDGDNNSGRVVRASHPSQWGSINPSIPRSIPQATFNKSSSHSCIHECAHGMTHAFDSSIHPFSNFHVSHSITRQFMPEFPSTFRPSIHASAVRYPCSPSMHVVHSSMYSHDHLLNTSLSHLCIGVFTNSLHTLTHECIHSSIHAPINSFSQFFQGGRSSMNTSTRTSMHSCLNPCLQ